MDLDPELVRLRDALHACDAQAVELAHDVQGRLLRGHGASTWQVARAALLVTDTLGAFARTPEMGSLRSFAEALEQEWVERPDHLGVVRLALLLIRLRVKRFMNVARRDEELAAGMQIVLEDDTRPWIVALESMEDDDRRTAGTVLGELVARLRIESERLLRDEGNGAVAADPALVGHSLLMTMVASRVHPFVDRFDPVFARVNAKRILMARGNETLEPFSSPASDALQLAQADLQRLGGLFLPDVEADRLSYLIVARPALTDARAAANDRGGAWQYGLAVVEEMRQHGLTADADGFRQMMVRRGYDPRP